MTDWYFEDQLLDMDLSSIDSNHENINLFDFLSLGRDDNNNQEKIKKESPTTNKNKNVLMPLQFPDKNGNNKNSLNENMEENNKSNEYEFSSSYYNPNEINFNHYNFSSKYLMSKKTIKTELEEIVDDIRDNNILRNNNQLYPNKRNHNGEELCNKQQSNDYYAHYYKNLKTEGDFFYNPNQMKMENESSSNQLNTMNYSLNPQQIKSELDNIGKSSNSNAFNGSFNYLNNPTAVLNQNSNSDLKVITQPPIEVRLRTNGDKRCFKVKVQLKDYKEGQGTEIGVELLYSKDRLRNTFQRVEKQEILGGTKKMKVESDGAATFKSLCVWEASKKHGEREFSLRFFVVGKGENEDVNSPFFKHSVVTDAFYTYSHQRILTKRKALTVRTLNKMWGTENEIMHIIGKGFIEGPHIGVMIARKDGVKFQSPSIEFYSDSVIFFQLPNINRKLDEDVEVDIFVTNDGRSYSNPSKMFYQKIK
eukprot:TRINITY_DN3621_c0_g1_i1.p1 TRINITY_DN3621_c0_g1~~TRINITY_DN3621_c0_g1_i1.p1  ORF type:complete len:477 (+),score=134.83 TRINITY_DN3621_c0_g1_i1:512-1942(+)